jgi:hypothetical protein
VNRLESVDARLGPLVVRRSCRVGDSRGGRLGRLISDRGGGDRLESLIFTTISMIVMNVAVILMILINIVVILIIPMNLTMILMIILTVGDKKSRWKTLTVVPWHQHVISADTIRGYPDYPDSQDILKDTDIPDTIRG